MESLSRSSTSSARLYFLCGPRLLAHLGSTHALLTAAANTLSCGAPLVAQRTTQVLDDRRALDKRAQDLESELANSIANQLADDTRKAEGRFVRHIHRLDDSANTLGFLSLIATAFSSVIGSGEQKEYLIVISSSPSSASNTGTNVVLVVGTDEKKVKEVGEGLKAKLEVKGGGRGPRWSGKFTGVWKNGRTDAVVEELLA